MNLFAYKAAQTLKKTAPLADRMRPTVLDDFVGQEAVVGSGSMLRSLIESDNVPSMIFWGPPGTGKTTLARIIAKLTSSRFVQMSAVGSGVADLRQIVVETKERLELHATRTVVFIDEIHRWNKAQQDAFLPHVEDGTVTLIGATTENPSFEVNAALLSRCRVFVLEKLSGEAIERLLDRAIKDAESGLGAFKIEPEPDVLRLLAGAADGDARTALNALELACQASGNKAGVIYLQKQAVAQALNRTHLLYDKGGEEHYNIISALHKSLRGSDANASLYWLGRMLEAGEDPTYVARRLVRFASEDIGLADPQALVQANAAFFAAERLGMPECNVCLAQAAVYMARAPKSNALYAAYGAVQRDIATEPNAPVPLHLRNAPTELMKQLDYGRGYKYTPDHQDDPEQDYLPDALHGKKYLP